MYINCAIQNKRKSNRIIVNDKTRFLYALRTFSVFNQRNLASKCFRQIQRNILQYLPLRRKLHSEIFQNITLTLKEKYVLETK